MPEFVDPITGNGDYYFEDPTTYEFRFTSNDLTLNDSYELDWEVEVCEFFDDDCDDAVGQLKQELDCHGNHKHGTMEPDAWNHGLRRLYSRLFEQRDQWRFVRV